jgi:hypothetical protein
MMRKSKRRKVPKRKFISRFQTPKFEIVKINIQTTRADALFGQAPAHEVLESLLAYQRQAI